MTTLAAPPTPGPDLGSIAVVIALLSSLVSVVGLISTSLLSWRKDRREARVADIDLEKQAMALERERLALQKQRLELEAEMAKSKSEIIQVRR